MTETITTNENQPKEEKIKKLIQRRIDELEKQWWENASKPLAQKLIEYAQSHFKELLKEIETL